MNLATLKIISAVDDALITSHDIQSVLQETQKTLGREGDFIGKSTTILHVNHTHVVKLHITQKFSDAAIAFTWVGHHAKKEQVAEVYHPSRCWFIMQYEGCWVPGNITIRLLPVHTIFESLSEARDQHLSLLSDIIVMYLSYAVKMDKRLDEGLSNFGLDGDRLYYLDDDIFEWDQFHAFSALIAGWFRRYNSTWFTIDAATSLAETLNHHLKDCFQNIPGLDASQVVAEQLHGMFFPSGAIQDAVNAFIAVLRYGASTCAMNKKQEFEDLEVFSTYFHEDEPIAILADVHANLPALEAVLSEVRRQGIERVFVLGDLVGYGPHPEACIDLLHKIGAVSLRGNHDHAIGTGNMVSSMSSSSSWTADWTIQRITQKHKDYLSRLPLRMISRPWLAVHGAPVDKTFFNAYVYNRTAESNLHWMQEQGYRFALHGHSHLQGVYATQTMDIVYRKDRYIDLNIYKTSLICPGSVGQPRGGETGAAFAILKPLSCQLELLCLPYDVSGVIQDMVIHHFPEQLMRRLKTGV